MRGDLNDPQSIRAALADCYGCFGVTNFWEHFQREYEQGKNLVDAVAASDIQHFVFSGLPHVKKRTNGELDVPHFDIKARLEDYARERDLPMTAIHVAFYYENFIYFFPPQRQEDGSYQIGFPQGETRLAMVSVEDVGGVVAPIFEHPEEFIGRTVGVVGEDRPVAELAHMFDFNRRFIPNRQEHLEETKRLHPRVQSFEEWLRKNVERFEPILSA